MFFVIESLRLLIGDLVNRAKDIVLPKGSDRARSIPVLITNWAGFSQPIVLEQAEERIHLPLYTNKEIRFDACIVYKPRPGVVSALVFMKDLEEQKLREHPLFQ